MLALPKPALGSNSLSQRGSPAGIRNQDPDFNPDRNECPWLLEIEP